jgi:hypothetical protein
MGVRRVLPHGGGDGVGAARSVSKGPPAGDQDPVAVGAGGAQRDQGRDGVPIGGPGALCWILNRLKPSKSIQTRSKIFLIISNLIHSKKGIPKIDFFKENMVVKFLKKGTPFSIGTSPDLK